MKFQFVAPELSSPTFETLKEHTQKAFAKLTRFLSEDIIIRISVQKDGKFFKIICELHNKSLIAHSHDRNLRKAINNVARDLKTLVLKEKDKLIN